MQATGAVRKTRTRRIVLGCLGCGGLFGLCLLVSLVVALLAPNTETTADRPSPTQVDALAPIQAAMPTTAPTQAPTNTPATQPEPPAEQVKAFQITAPKQGAVLRNQTITVTGTGTPGAKIVHDIPAAFD